jgi:hypothetical protein
MEFSKVHIKGLSRPKLLKLMRGGAVRITRPENASDAMEMIILPEHTKSILSKFGKGKAHTMQLTQAEMDMNSMEGGSLYGMFKKGLKYSAPVLKQGARAGIAVGSAALAASNPALIPFIPAGAAMLGSMSDQAFDDLGNMNVDSIDEGYGQYGNMARDYAQNYAEDYATDYVQKQPSYQRGLAQVNKYASKAPAYMQYAEEEPYSQLGNAGMREMSSYGNLGSSYNDLSNRVSASSARQKLNHRQSRQVEQSRGRNMSQRGRGLFAGQGLYAGNMRGRGIEKSTVRIGGNLISAFGGMHPATVSAPLSVNFASRNFMSPAMAALIQ